MPRPTPELSWRCRSQRFLCGRRTLVMGILNVTPDSFSDGGRFLEADEAVAHAREMVDAGADIIDVGGESSRPGSDPVPIEEEIQRVVPVVEAIRGEIETPISVDTTKAEVARHAIKAGADIVNDITALGDPEMATVVADSGAGLVLMHMQGEPKTMQEAPRYRDVLGEVEFFLRGRIRTACEAGVDLEQVCIDPGIGFGKRLEDNLALIAAGWRLRRLGVPVLLGMSRKSFIKAISDVEIDQRLEGSLASAVAGVVLGADIVRIHDVAETRRAIEIADALKPYAPPVSL